MVVYFFDTSALVKRYSSEPGSPWVSNITDPRSGNSIYIADITAVEVVSALMKKTRERQLALADAQKAIGQFENDLQNQYVVFNLTHQIIENAMILPQKHVLVAYDAVQLAAALEIGGRSRRLGIPLTGAPSLILVSSDVRLLDAARAEGLAVDDPRNHP